MSGTMDNYQKIEKIGEGMYFRPGLVTYNPTHASMVCRHLRCGLQGP